VPDGLRSPAARCAKLARIDWKHAAADLDRWGFARVPGLLGARDCERLAALYARDAGFRKTISMDAHRFGSGEYRYFSYPLPSRVQRLREALYPELAAIANAWQERLGDPARFESTLAGVLRRCHAEGQVRPTPLLLRYEAGGFNNLHQDLYGAIAFPLQVTILLSRPRVDFEGGEFLLVEQRPRAQSVGQAIVGRQGDLVVFTNRIRPARGARGFYRVNVRHGVSRLRSGTRYTLGIIFHDAE